MTLQDKITAAAEYLLQKIAMRPTIALVLGSGLGDYADTLENAIRKMTGLPAMVYNLPTKGLIREGMDADLVLFDPETVADLGDFAQPTRGNTGFACVLVNGQIALEKDCVTDTLAGKPFFREAD
jgi:N-acyl-D-aspartate/D-glutamate deacylase